MDKEKPKYLKAFDRTLLNKTDLFANNKYRRNGAGGDLIPFVWSTERSKSFESFYECYESWHEKAKNDKTINLNEMFSTYEFTEEHERRNRDGGRRRNPVMRQLGWYINLEDELECSGMCRPALFYFGRNITKDGYPPDTCLHKLKKYMMENAVPYSVFCTLLALTSFFLSIISICLTRRDEPTEKRDFDNINRGHQELAQSSNMGA